MRQLNDFECEDGHVEEHFIDSSITEVRCTCGKTATKAIKNVNFKEDVGPKANTKSVLRWARKREKDMKRLKRQAAKNGE